MGWNGSDGKSPVSASATKTASSAGFPQWVLYGLIGGGVIATIAVGYCLMSSNGKTSAPAPKPISKPIPAATPAVPKPAAEAPDPNIISIRKTINPFTGEEMLMTNRHHEVAANAARIGRPHPKNKFQPKRKLFKHHSENYICAVMRTPPGVPMIQGRLPKNFDEDFLASYKEEIKIEPEDSEEDILYKNAMIDFKKKVKAELDAGKSVSEIVLESRKEVNDLADYRKNLMKQLGEMRRNGASAEDLGDAREAANIMLEHKGIKKIGADLPRKGEE